MTPYINGVYLTDPAVAAAFSACCEGKFTLGWPHATMEQNGGGEAAAAPPQQGSAGRGSAERRDDAAPAARPVSNGSAETSGETCIFQAVGDALQIAPCLTCVKRCSEDVYDDLVHLAAGDLDPADLLRTKNQCLHCVDPCKARSAHNPPPAAASARRRAPCAAVSRHGGPARRRT
jgi:hypothetical protein